MDAVIIAGGFGTRLRPLTYAIPKPLIEIAGKPVLFHTLKKLEASGIENTTIATNYMAGAISEFIKEYDWGMFVHCVEEKTPLGTAGAVRNCSEYITDRVIVLQGDSINDIDLKKCMAAHKEGVSITVKAVENPSEFGVVKLGYRKKITKFQEKPKPGKEISKLANTGIYVLDNEILDYIPKRKQVDFSLDLFPHLMKLKKPFHAHIVKDYWADVGRINNYLLANEWFMGTKKIAHINESANVSSLAILKPPYHIGQNAIIKKGAIVGPYSVIGKNCIVNEHATISTSIIYHHTSIGSGVKISNSVIGDKCTILDKACVYDGSMLGEGCEIGENAAILSQSRLGPFVRLQNGNTFQGILSPSSMKMSLVTEAMKILPSFIDLERDTLQVCLTLAEYGELSRGSLSSLSKLPEKQVDIALQKLMDLGFIRPNREMFSLLYEEPELIQKYLKTALSQSSLISKLGKIVKI